MNETPEETLRHALRQAYDELEKRALQYTNDCISSKRRLQQEIAEHRRIEYALYYQAEFAKLIATISINFIQLSQGKVHSAIENALKRIGEFVGVDRCYVLLFSRDRKRIVDIFEWCAKGIKPQIQNLKGHLVGKEFPWFAKKIRRRGVLYVPCCDKLPLEAHAEKEYFQAHGIQSLITVPMFCGRSFIGCMGFDSVQVRKPWAVDIIVLLRIVGKIFANALERIRTEEMLTKSEKTIDQYSNVFQKEQIKSLILRHHHI